MESSKRRHHLFTRLANAVKALTGRLRLKADPPGMIGLPPSARGLTGRPADPALHAEAVAYEWADVADAYSRTRMRDLGIRDDKIGVRRREMNYQRTAFLPGERDGGGMTPDGINVDSGVLNPELNAGAIGRAASEFWKKSAISRSY